MKLNINLFAMIIFLFIASNLYAETLFEVKDAQDSTVFSISDDGMRVFNLGDTLMVISASEIKAFIEDSKDRALSRSFSISTNTTGKEGMVDVLKVTKDATQMREGVLGEKYTDFSRSNLFLGVEAGVATTGYNNIFFGNYAGKENAYGDNNLFIGSNAGRYSGFGDNNIFLGNQSGYNNLEGNSNIFIGLWSGYSNTTGYNNIFVGEHTGYSNTTGYSNVFIGLRSGYSNRFGGNNVFLGEEAGYSCLNGGNNVFLGESAGRTIEDAYGNVFLGQSAGKILLSGDMNTYVGYYAGSGYGGGTDFNGNVYVGAYSGTYCEGDYNVFLGYNSGSNELNSNRLYIDNSNTSTPLIYGEFDTNLLRVNGVLDVIGNTFVDGNVGIGTTPLTGYGIRVLDSYRGINSEASTTTGSYTYGVYGTGTGGSTGNRGVCGYALGSGNTNYGIYGSASGGTTNYAGYFSGDINVTGTVLKSASKTKIDHPLDPKNKFLIHSSVESDNRMNIYNGNVILDSEGKATVKMSDWFESLNTEFRYQLTPMGTSAPELYLAKEISDKTFEIAGGKPNMKVSWQVTGIRNDNYAKENPIEVETNKNSIERGYYLHPESFGQPKEMGIEFQHEKAMNENAKN
ncbi:MAG: hypothetical protein GQ534_08025 [Candidatus Delongbacteria bacterium]|nr:hypothetical protein [Candidatus Delongbacteria bacterium]